MKYLFYFVHPAKFQFHKEQIRELRKRGHTVDIIINTKDVLEDLLREETWEYTNLFPKGRKIKGLHVYIAALVSIVRTIYKLYKYTYKKKYDLYVGDLLTILGRFKRVPSLIHSDDVIRQVPEQSIFLLTCNHIISPTITQLGIFNKKKVSYDGYKALAYVHPSVFTPSKDVIHSKYRDSKLFLIRCTGFAATHDIGRKGIDDLALEKIIDFLKDKGNILISSERSLPTEFKKYEYNFNKKDIFHYMAFADLFISDSVTMSTEAALLGTPVVEYDDYWFEMEQMLELEYKYGLIFLYRPPQIDQALTKIVEIVESSTYKLFAQKNKDLFLKEKIDVNKFLVWFMENYPQSFKEYKGLPFLQYKYR